MPSPTRTEFLELIERTDSPPASEARTRCVPIVVRLLSDQLTPVLAYRRLVSGDERTAPSFLLESVENGERQGRHSMLGAQPALELTAKGNRVTLIDHHQPANGDTDDAGRSTSFDLDDPLTKLREIAAQYQLITPPGLSLPLLGGLVGYAGYDTVRYAEPGKLDPANAPKDDRDLPDLQFGFYDSVIVFDHAQKIVNVVQLAMVEPGDDPARCYDEAINRLDGRIAQIERHSKPLMSGRLASGATSTPMPSNLTRDEHAAMVQTVLEYIRAGDIFQCVVGQRFERKSTADPFDVYRALRTVNPSPYMVYMQGQGCILVASSPEILCRVHHDEEGNGVVTNRPLAGTRKRGTTPEEDAALEADLLADDKERAEHSMLVDLGRNDVGQVAQSGSVRLDKLMQIERYSHVMHISSTVTGILRDGKDCWDALRATLPVGTISGAPKIRAMQIIDELEPVRRGPYGGGMGYVGLDGQMDIALTLRTMVVPTALRDGDTWTYHIQAAGGIVADSKPEPEYQETVNKAAALARAIDAAEEAFGGGTGH